MTYDCGNPFRFAMFPAERTSMCSAVGRTGQRLGMLNYPAFLDASAGDIVISDRDNHRIQVLDATAATNRFESYGSLGQGVGHLCRPGGVSVVDMADTKIVVADTGNSRVVFLKVVPDRHGHGSLCQSYSFQQQMFDQPLGVSTDCARDRMFITDAGKRRVTIHDLLGNHIGTVRPDPSLMHFDPYDVTMDEYGRAYVTDLTNKCVQVFGPNGDFLFRFGDFGRGAGQFAKPVGICFDKARNLMVADEELGRVQMFTSDGRFRKQVVEGIYLPKGISVNIYEHLVVLTGDPFSFLKIFKYK